VTELKLYIGVVWYLDGISGCR